jgi:hypothetical protein
MISLTFGVMPTREQFAECFSREVPGGVYRIRNDKLMGDADFDEQELWDEINEHVSAPDWLNTLGDDTSIESLISCILYTLGIEWI